jgi:hypothetical protein
MSDSGSQHFNLDGQLVTLDFAMSEEKDEVDYKITSDDKISPQQLAYILHITAKAICVANNIDVSRFILDLVPDKNTH